MTLPVSPATTVVGPASVKGLARKLLGNPLGLVSIIILGILIIVAVIAPWILPYDPNHGELQLVNTTPSAAHLMGTDGSGRDILSRLIAGTQSTLFAALIGTVVAIVAGVTFGLIAGYYGRWLDAIGSWISNILMAIPAIIALLALYSAVGSSTEAAMVLFGFLVSPSLFRLVRNLVIGVKNELYVDAARVSGLSDLRIITKHVFFAIRAPIIIQAAFIAGATIGIQAGLDFLGLGDANQASWGGMLQEAFANLFIAPVQLVWPGVTLALAVSSLVLFGNALRDELEGARRERHKRRTVTSAVAKVAERRDGDADQIDLRKSLLAVRGLKIAYPTGPKGSLVDVVNGIDLEVHEGEVVGLVGESGSGKTQTAFAILGLLPQEAVVTGGAIKLGGLDLLSLPPKEMSRIRGRLVAYIPQEPMSNLDPSFRIGKQLMYGVKAVTGVSSKEAKTRVLEMLARVGLPDPVRTFSAYPHQVSGGMAQRVLIAGAVACEPQLLIADEPTTALDVTVQAEILELLRDLQVERRMGILLVTHNFGVVADLCDRVAVMQKGEIVEQESAEAIFANPQHPYTKTLLNAILSEDIVRPELVEVIEGAK
jgi:peptide/nickel transport system permease protein